MIVAEVRLWGRRIAAVSLAADSEVADFQYDPDFARSGIEVAPLTMPLNDRVYRFPELPRGSFHGLPGLLADSLPDRFGNALINAWLATQGRSAESFNAVERLCYTGERGMGGLEFYPVNGPRADDSSALSVDQLVALASEVLSHRSELRGEFGAPRHTQTMADILRVGTSAGGARAKAVIAWNPVSGEVRSGQVAAATGFEYWILKFDGVTGNRDKEREDPQGYGVIEYAYSLMARDCGINMPETRLFEEGPRRHFMSRRFDRTPDGRKLHMQSLGALAHFDYNMAGAYAYEQALQVIRRLGLPVSTVEEQFRRMVFNVMARNQDDHVKNIAFLMDKAGNWSLSPAFDMTYSYDPGGLWTATHQMTINGKRDAFTLADFLTCAETAAINRDCAERIVDEVRTAVANWQHYAATVGVSADWQERVQRTLRLNPET